MQALDSRIRVIVDPAGDAADNMATDAELLQSWDSGQAPVLRLYAWDPPGISLGYMQDAESLLNLAVCRKDGIGVVRRPTGGRAILHWQELTYCVVASTGDPRFGRNLAETHAIIGDCLARGLAHLGVEADLSRAERDAGRQRLRQPCFASSGRAELLVNGRKIAGSAQRRLRHKFLQHGSILLGPAHLKIVDYLSDLGDAGLRQRARRRLRQDTTHLQQVLGTAPSFETVALALLRGFRDRLGRSRPQESVAGTE